jgi:hypothetical protein
VRGAVGVGATGAQRGTWYQRAYEQTLATAPRLAQADWAAAWAAGTALTAAEAVAETLEPWAPPAPLG